jgi:hypothetical protein
MSRKKILKKIVSYVYLFFFQDMKGEPQIFLVGSENAYLVLLRKSTNYTSNEIAGFPLSFVPHLYADELSLNTSSVRRLLPWYQDNDTCSVDFLCVLLITY